MSSSILGVTIADADGGQTLRQRLRRAASVLRNTRRERGLLAAVALFLRLLSRKGPTLVQQLVAWRRRTQVVAAVANLRAEVPPGELLMALAVTGGLGDFLVIARFLRDVLAHVGNLQFDVYSPTPKLARWVFGAIPGLRNTYHDILFDQTVGEYDIGLRANQFVVVYRERLRWSSVRDNEPLMELIDTLVRVRSKIDVFVDRHPWMDNFLARTAVFSGATRRDFLHHLAGIAYGGDAFPVPCNATATERFGLRRRQFVTVNNGFDTGFVISGRRATKCYPHFGAVIERLRTALPGVMFVQVGSTTSERIDECDVNLVNQTSLDEVAGLIADAILHIDNEGGLVHLAACVGTRAAVVFGPTPSDYFAYPDNINLDPPICGNCWWMNRTWMDYCAKGYEAPRCMTEQDPGAVANQILDALGEISLQNDDDTTPGALTAMVFDNALEQRLAS